ncbi:MAG: serine/threonine protein kinase [Gemmatimonadaceae bacterium]|nr:serine/threonine protein kinase [Gemmatimonadaceae bacterium]
MPDSAAQSAEDLELRAHVENALCATYEVDQEIGRGGMGIVYRARDKRLKRHVAIKLLPPELSFRRDVRTRFLREAETAAQLSHPNIVPIYSVDEVGNLVFFVMALIDGDNLAKQLQKRGPLPIEDVRRWLTEVGEALAYAHSRGVIHRDIKPDNILVDAIDGRALVTDFGIARAGTDSGDTPRLTATGMAIGTPAYMSPEQASGDRDLDARSDLYSLGIVAYQMLVGEPPFIGNTTPALLVKHLAEMPVPVDQRRQDVPPDLARIVMRLLEKAPEQRFQTAGELVQAMKSGVVPQTPIPAGTSGSSSPIMFNGAPIGGMRVAGQSGTAGNPGYSAPAYSSRTGVASSVPAPLVGTVGASYPALGTDTYSPGMEERARWEAPLVRKFRKMLGPYLFVNGALLLVSIFGNSDFFGVTTIWTVIMAWKYAKLWSAGYDWHDVLRQHRDRMLGEVISDVVDSVHATFSRKKRDELRLQGRLNNNALRGVLAPQAPTPAAGSAAIPRSFSRSESAGRGAMLPTAPARDDAMGEYVGLVRQARADREEIGRLLATIPPAERGRIPDVSATAIDLVNRIESMVVDLTLSAREFGADRAVVIDKEIATLESEANPLETAKSEARVRRLAQLRRDRRAVADVERKREVRKAQVESCRLALENMRLDLVRLRTGNSSVQSVTLIAEQAMALARDVDIAVGAASDVRDATRGRAATPA